jgi:hypothetical protein
MAGRTVYTTSIVAKLAPPPLTYQFTTTANAASDADLVFCHFFFVNATMGNTVTWQFVNEAGDKAVTFSAPPTAAASTSRTSTTLVPTTSATSAPVSPSTSSPASSASSSLSSGARAGIGVGVVIAAMLLVGCVVLFFASRRRPGQVGEVDRKALPDVKQPFQPVAIQPPRPPAELDGTGVRRELP